MNDHPFFAFALSICFIPMLCSISAANCGEPWKTPLTEVTGSIRKTYYSLFQGKAEQEGWHLEVEIPPEKTAVVHVVPAQCRRNNPLRFKELRQGDTITVTGSALLIGQQLHICAAEIPSHGFIQEQGMQLRDAETGLLNTGVYCKNCEQECAGSRNRECCMKGCQTARPFICPKKKAGRGVGPKGAGGPRPR